MQTGTVAGIESIVGMYYASVPIRGGLRVMDPKDAGNPYFTEFFLEYRRVFGAVESYVISQLHSLAYLRIQLKGGSMSDSETEMKVERAVIAPLEQMVQTARNQYAGLRNGNTPPNLAFDASIRPVVELVQALTELNVNPPPPKSVFEPPTLPSTGILGKYVEEVSRHL